MYIVKLADGTEIDNLELNGNNFITDTPIDTSAFRNNLESVTVIDNNGNVEKLNNVKVLFSKVLDKQSFILVEKTTDEIEKETNNKHLFDLDYRLTLQELGLGGVL